MHPTRRQVLGSLAAAGAATLVDPGQVLARLAADVPCSAAGQAGELLGTLPLFRDRAQVQAFGGETNLRKAVKREVEHIRWNSRKD